ncbi:ankyrin repeat-containing domain protein [Mycena rebaudengoi]|nr:ankyrin repeat-containing domain protein [Mycena rebaudengoi]
MGPTVCLMLTSRHDVSLRNITAETFEIRVPEEDIQKYVEHQINKSTRLSLHVGTCSQLREEIIAKILANADRMFLLGKLHIESLAACTTIATIRERLNKLSSNLELAYSQAMERIDIQAEEQKKLAYSTLTWRPEMKIILSVCAGLVIVDEERSVVRLVHATTQEYFDGRFPGAHAEITRTLLTYMVFDEVQVTLGKQIWGVEEKHALIEYCQHCFVHAQNIRQLERQLQELIIDFLQRTVAWRSFWKYSRACPWNYPSWPKAPSPLWVAAAANLQEIAQYLLNDGISPDSGQIQDDSPLCAASFYGHRHIAELLLEAGANINIEGGPACSALEAASGRGHLDIVHLLLEKGADIHAGHNGALRRASQNGHANVLQEMTARCGPASESGHTEVAQVLLEKGADANVTSGNSESLLITTSAGKCMQPRQHVNIVRLLLENGADIHARNNGALRAASKRGYTDIIQLLLQHGANVNAADEHTGSALEAAACWDGNPSIDPFDSEHAKRRKMAEAATRRLMHVRFLLDNGADVHARNNGALREAAKAGNTEVVQLLLKHGANVNAADEHTGSPLEAAASWDGNPSSSRWDSEDQKIRKMAEAATRRLTHVRLLLDNGADVHAGNNGALRAASKAGYTDIIQVLLEHGANMNASGKDNVSALEAVANWDGSPDPMHPWASEDEKRRNMTKAAPRNNGTLREAAKAGNTEVVQLLLENGANRTPGTQRMKQQDKWQRPLRAGSGRSLSCSITVPTVHGGNNGALREANTEVEQFLNHGADALENAETESQNAEPTMAEAATRRLTHVPFLLDNVADVHGGNNVALREAAEAGNTEVEQFLNHEADALENAETESQNAEPTRKMAEAATRRLTQVPFLLDNGADVHGGNNVALREAAEAGNTEVEQFLTHEADALENAEMESQNAEPTRKMAEAATRRLTHVPFLLDNVADINGGNNVALREAAEAGNTEVEQFLNHEADALENAEPESQTAEPTRKMAEGATCRLTHVPFLLDNSADVHGGNNGALLEAAEAGNTEVEQTLSQNRRLRQTPQSLSQNAEKDSSEAELSQNTETDSSEPNPSQITSTSTSTHPSLSDARIADRYIPRRRYASCYRPSQRESARECVCVCEAQRETGEEVEIRQKEMPMMEGVDERTMQTLGRGGVDPPDTSARYLDGAWHMIKAKKQRGDPAGSPKAISRMQVLLRRKAVTWRKRLWLPLRSRAVNAAGFTRLGFKQLHIHIVLSPVWVAEQHRRQPKLGNVAVLLLRGTHYICEGAVQVVYVDKACTGAYRDVTPVPHQYDGSQSGVWVGEVRRIEQGRDAVAMNVLDRISFAVLERKAKGCERWKLDEFRAAIPINGQMTQRGKARPHARRECGLRPVQFNNRRHPWGYSVRKLTIGQFKGAEKRGSQKKHVQSHGIQPWTTPRSAGTRERWPGTGPRPFDVEVGDFAGGGACQFGLEFGPKRGCPDNDVAEAATNLGYGPIKRSLST